MRGLSVDLEKGVGTVTPQLHVYLVPPFCSLKLGRPPCQTQFFGHTPETKVEGII